MAAGRGWWKGQARRAARREAEERHTLAAWWSGKQESSEFAAAYPGVRAIELENRVGHSRVVVLWRRLEDGTQAYGFGAGGNLREACWRALVEMERSAHLLKSFFIENPGFGEDDLSVIENYMERRMLYYALPCGQKEFQHRLDMRQGPGTGPRPAPLVDLEIPGPWARYATVWRVLYPLDTVDHLIPQLNTFFW